MNLYLTSVTNLKKKKNITKFLSKIKDEVIIFSNNGEIKVFSSICPHFGGPITCDNSHLKCPWHNYKFSKTNGQCLTHGLKIYLPEYEVKIINNKIYIHIDD